MCCQGLEALVKGAPPSQHRLDFLEKGALGSQNYFDDLVLAMENVSPACQCLTVALGTGGVTPACQSRISALEIGGVTLACQNWTSAWCRELTTLWVARLDDGAELKVTDPKEQHGDVEEEEAEG